MSLLLLSAKGHARFACSVVNALTTAPCRYQPFAGAPFGKAFGFKHKKFNKVYLLIIGINLPVRLDFALRI